MKNYKMTVGQSLEKDIAFMLSLHNTLTHSIFYAINNETVIAIDTF